MSSLDYLDLCRLCLVKDQVSVPIFDGEGDVRQIFLKIAACLPVKLTRDDKLPKKICNDCVYKVELFYEFWNTTSNSEKQLMQWLGEVDVNDKQTYVTAVINQDQSSDNRLDGNVMQQTNEHQNNMGMNIIETMSLEMPMMMSTDQTQMTINTTNNSNSQSIQALPGTSAQQKDGMGESEEDNSDDDMDRDEGLPVKEEIIQDTNRIIEPGAFLNVSLPCDEPGPSGLQQQKNADIPDMVIGGQTTESDNKAGKKRKRRGRSKQPSTEKKQLVFIKDEIDDDILSKAMSVGVQDVYDCSYCGLIFPSQTSVNIHEANYHKSQVYECTQCNFKTQSSIGIDRHLKKFHLHDERCRLCSKKFNHDKKLIEHIKREHLAFKEKDLEIIRENPIFHHDEIITPASDNDYKWIQGSDFKCGYCRNRYLEKMDLIKHFESCTNVKINNEFQCRLCSFKSTIKGRVDSHYYDTHKTNFFSCNDCNEKFKLLSELLVHISEQHVEYSTFDCNYCVKKFVLKTSLDYHLSTFHEDQIDTVKYSKYQCVNCQAMFKTDSELLTHVKNHPPCMLHCNNCESVEKSGKCSSTDDCVEFNCKKRTRQSYKNAHKTIDDNEDVHVIDVENPIELFDCERCDKKFKTKKKLDTHMSSHLDKVSTFFQCTLCQVYCEGKKEFKKHMQAHSSKINKGGV